MSPTPAAAVSRRFCRRRTPISGNYFTVWSAAAPVTANGTYAYYFADGALPFPTPTLTATATPAVTPTATGTATPTATATSTATPTATPTGAATSTATATATAPPTATITATPVIFGSWNQVIAFGIPGNIWRAGTSVNNSNAMTYSMSLHFGKGSRAYPRTARLERKVMGCSVDREIAGAAVVGGRCAGFPAPVGRTQPESLR